jgi:hypothetical protein
MQVTAIKRGFIYGQLRREGDVFELKQDEHFTSVWMAKGEQEIKEPEIKHANVKKTMKGTDTSNIKYQRLEIPSLMEKESTEKKTLSKKS